MNQEEFAALEALSRKTRLTSFLFQTTGSFNLEMAKKSGIFEVSNGCGIAMPLSNSVEPSFSLDNTRSIKSSGKETVFLIWATIWPRTSFCVWTSDKFMNNAGSHKLVIFCSLDNPCRVFRIKDISSSVMKLEMLSVFTGIFTGISIAAHDLNRIINDFHCGTCAIQFCQRRAGAQ